MVLNNLFSSIHSFIHSFIHSPFLAPYFSVLHPLVSFIPLSFFVPPLISISHIIVVGLICAVLLQTKKQTNKQIPRSRVLLDNLTAATVRREMPRLLWNLQVHYTAP